MKVRLLVFGLILAVGIGALMPPGVSAQPTPTWVQVNADGFGEWQNMQIPALAVFGGYLYAGVWHIDDVNWTVSAQIWRTSDSKNWEKVFDAQANGISALITYKDSIYAGSWGPDGKMWRSHNGIDWEDVTDGLTAVSLDTARLAVFKNALYASSFNENTGTEIWVTTNGTQWDPFIVQGMGDPNNYGATSDAVFKGRLYWGVSNEVSGAKLWRTDGVTTETIITDGFGMNIGSLSSLAKYGNYLYAGGWWGDAIQVWRSLNGTDWEQVHVLHIPFGAITALEVFGNELFLVAENWDTGMEVWSTSNGVDWVQFGFDGFGDPNNAWSYWDNGTVVFRDKLYIATNNYWSGGEVWMYCPTGCP